MDISWREVCQWTSAGGRCANGHQLEGGVPVDISWREVCQWTSAGGRCANGHQLEGGVSMDISWREVCQWISAGGRCANGHQLEGGVSMQPLSTHVHAQHDSSVCTAQTNQHSALSSTSTG